VLPELHLLLLDGVAGAAVKDLVCDTADAAARAAHWLAAFQDARVQLPAVYALHHPLARARRWSARLQRGAPALAGAVARLEDALNAAPPPWPPQPRPLLIHGDFTAGHIFIAPQTTTVIDWDSCRPGDPPEDAGRFLASLSYLAARQRVSMPTAATAAASFRATYAESHPAAAASLPFYTALACLRKASQLVGASSPRAGISARPERAAVSARRDARRHTRQAGVLLEAAFASLAAAHPA
jgi:aminoglycoside phosphotransferase (APT) family kinase protein